MGCAKDLLQSMVHTFLCWVALSFSWSLSLMMCLERQLQARWAAKILPPYPSDLSPQMSQSLGLLPGSQEPLVVHTYLSPGRVWCQVPFKVWKPWSSRDGLTAPSTFIVLGVKGARHPPRVGFISSGHEPSGRAALHLSSGPSTTKSQRGTTSVKRSHFALHVSHRVLFFLAILNLQE